MLFLSPSKTRTKKRRSISFSLTQGLAHPFLFTAEQDGTVELFHDEQIASRTVELRSKNLSTTSITCPPDKSKSLGIRLPFLVLLLKELGEHFSFEVQVLDDKGNRRRFRASNFQVSSMHGMGSLRMHVPMNSSLITDHIPELF